jgi:hypothetical protein
MLHPGALETNELQGTTLLHGLRCSMATRRSWAEVQQNSLFIAEQQTYDSKSFVGGERPTRLFRGSPQAKEPDVPLRRFML